MAAVESILQRVEDRVRRLSRRQGKLCPLPVRVTFEAAMAALASPDPRKLGDSFTQEEWEGFLQQLSFEELEILVGLLEAKERTANPLPCATQPCPTQGVLGASPSGSVVAAQAEGTGAQIESCDAVLTPDDTDEPDRFELLELRRNPGDPPVMPPGSRTYGSVEDWDPYERYQQ